MRIKKTATAAVTVLAGLAAVLTVPTAAQATTGDGWIGFYNEHSSNATNKYMMLTAQNNTLGSAVDQNVLRWLSPTGSQQAYDQDWLQVPKDNGWVSMRNASSPQWYALAVSQGRTDNGAPIITWNYESTHHEQEWKRVHMTGDTANFDHIVNRKSGKCLASPNGNTGDWTQMIQWTCEGGHQEQEWATYDG